jgi:hypothetical protein
MHNYPADFLPACDAIKRIKQSRTKQIRTGTHPFAQSAAPGTVEIKTVGASPLFGRNHKITTQGLILDCFDQNITTTAFQ